MRNVLKLITATLVAMAFASPALAQSPGKALSGFRYVVVRPPQYPNGAADAYGFVSYLLETIRKDKTWTVVNDLTQAEQQDASRANEIVVCALGHDGEGGLTSPHVRLQFYDMTGTLVTTVDAKQSFFVGWTFDGAIKRAIDNALKEIAKNRRFDSKLVVDLAARYKNVERVEIDEERFRRYLDDNAERLKPVEGIWSSQDGVYKLGIMRLGTSERVVAFVIDTKNVLWRPKMVKATFESTAYPDLFTVNYYMGNHSNVGATGKLAGGLLSIPVTADGKQDVITLIKNYPANVATVDRPAASDTPADFVSGTGFAVGRNLIVTCYHVIQGAKRIEIRFEAGKQSYPLDVLSKDEANDLAVLRVLPNDKGAYPTFNPIAVVESGELRLGEQVYTLGFPLGSLLGESPKATEGTISALVGLQNDPRTLQISVPIQPGNSGGPLFDAKGRVVGVVVASLSARALFQLAGAMPQNVNFAIRSDYLLALIRRANPGAMPAASLANLPRVEQIEGLLISVGQVRAFVR